MVTTQDYHSVKLIVGLVYEIITEDIYKDFSKKKEIFSFQLSQNIMMIETNQLLVRWKMKQMVQLLKNLLNQSKNLFVFGR